MMGDLTCRKSESKPQGLVLPALPAKCGDAARQDWTRTLSLGRSRTRDGDGDSSRASILRSPADVGAVS
jgi:hypothetical protein